MRTPGRIVFGSLVNGTPLAFSSATAASMFATVRPMCSSPIYGICGGAPVIAGSALAMKIFCPVRLRSNRVEPSGCGVRITSAPSLSSYHCAVAAGSGERRWMCSQVYLVMARPSRSNARINLPDCPDSKGAFPNPPSDPTIGGMSRRTVEITADLMLRAYRHGLFPMAETRLGERLYWLDPERRGVLPLDRFHLPRRLARTVLSDVFTVTVDRDFAGTIAGCADPAPGRDDTWINPQIERLFGELHQLGHAHSVEARQEGHLVGGLYGVAIGGVFFGESMFSTARDSSKVALVHLVARLRLGGFRLLDTQFVTAHLSQFGALEIPRDTYRACLTAALEAPARWLPTPAPEALVAEFRALAGPSPA